MGQNEMKGKGKGKGKGGGAGLDGIPREEMYPHQCKYIELIINYYFTVAGKDLSDPNGEVKTNEWYQWYCEI